MSLITVMVMLAGLCVIGSLVLGIAAMTQNGVVGHRTSAQWMTMRVAFQGVALLLIMLGLWTG
jgi:Hypoxia induced protein conserved region